MVLSTQVRMRRGQSDALVQEPVSLSFTFEAVSVALNVSDKT